MRLDGKVAVVSGSSSGIGLAVAHAMLRAGAKVVFSSERPAESLPELTASLDPQSAIYVAANLLEDGQAERLIDAAWQQFGAVDILVNNLGTYREPPLLEVTRQQFDWIMHLNVWSGIALTQAMVRRNVAAKRGGRILFSTSLNGSRSEPLHTLYDASKGAVNALTRQLAIELAPMGFTTAAVAPGLVETPLTDMGLRSDAAGRQAVIDQIPVRRIATVDDIAPWFVFLASDAASYSTGCIVTVDGGLDAQQMALRPITEAEKSFG
ncbi:SDR family NAD(P)-dependent oxidoreductase [Tuwongella immobilis]|uniref:Uncharacterized protein n=1 Tax=Tuwongella immobilis TaxID=692036 RepID=A0A6C2YUH0_9BACT|nr:SDR family oxidoreductase [Tuwongella immobilis]VIP04512.1 short-chain dehydrogenase reductase sdr : Short-chain dehydrogenase/reductase SDR OS=Granulicella tundricola (strain ATCC BAA-1859 / DSM 23138 / MP5ACTX9) GN=AciX9_1360 PE=3 SV=1: adh_short_C2 [Tuwongella immobilis]VTS06386.1 short-chain dehydrogenase reductase sdr : Short-chain dehydrogenase/reductase SDR OS=Granulicella tundricola (strain ATCC BAA-1859 / DSM 23138 / MP5ACTX9) GN=AciX9_1360 PE=3 SV=1: adh_short_C2 [Tuwongella immobili